MPAPAAGATSAGRPARGGEGLRESLLARLRPVQAGEWQARVAALVSAGMCRMPTGAESAGPPPDPLAAPPDGEDAWLAELPGPLLDEYIAATAEPPRPEPLAAGLWDRASGDGAGFAAGGVADDIPPGPVLAGLAGDRWAEGLGNLTDDELIGVLRAGRRLAAWSASIELAAAGDLMRRRMGQEAAGQAGAAEHADAEIAAALTLTGRAADQLLDLAMTVGRLPLTAQALAAGVIDLPRVMAIADEVAGLADEHLAAVEQRVLATAARQTTTQVRAAARRAVIAADPAAMRKRRERAEREARVERWAEHAGTAALAGRDLPPTGALAADQHVSELARALRTAGAAGTMDQLRAQVFVALLSGQPVSTLLPPGAAAGAVPGSPSQLGGSGSPGGGAAPGSPGLPRAFGTSRPPGAPGSAGLVGFAAGVAVAGTVNLTMPVGTWLGLVESPGKVAGFGPLDAQDSRALARAMAADPRTRWCLTLTGPAGRPVAHGCAPRRRGPPPGGAGPPAPRESPLASAGSNTGPPASGSGTTGPPASASTGQPADTRAAPASRPPDPRPRTGAQTTAGPQPHAGAGAGRAAGIIAWVAGVPLAWLETGQCAHRRESASYRPPPSLQHLIRIRQQLCVFPGCGRAARRCDLDHTIPFHLGGRTCECNLAPLCRKHHQTKQTPGWRLDQPQPGTMAWTTPSGRRYTTNPTTYPQ